MSKLPAYALLFVSATFLPHKVVCSRAPDSQQRPNVLFISIDDLNDWVGCLRTHPQAYTPNIDRLAQRGCLFTDAHCASPLCNPSRASVYSGLTAVQTGVHDNGDGDIRAARPNVKLLPTAFKEAGYKTYGAGKLLHQSSRALFDEGYFPHLRWSPFDPAEVGYSESELSKKGTASQQHIISLKGRQYTLPLNGMPSDRQLKSPNGESFDWGPLPVEDEDMGDGKIAAWGAEVLAEKHEKPFFLAIGFYRPHIPLYAPQKYFDLFDADSIQLPETIEGDLQDLGSFARNLALEPDTAGAHQTVVHHQQWKEAVRSYLACISFVDAQVGKLIAALDESPYGENTLVVLWSDHGWHLGEKQHWGKWTLWQRSTRVPLVIVPPKVDADLGGRVVGRPTSLLDLYPTLKDYCNLTPGHELAGESLLGNLRGGESDFPERAVLTCLDRNSYALTKQKWRFIRYATDDVELYDREADPKEWHNLAPTRSETQISRWERELRASISRLKAPPGH